MLHPGGVKKEGGGEVVAYTLERRQRGNLSPLSIVVRRTSFSTLP